MVSVKFVNIPNTPSPIYECFKSFQLNLSMFKINLVNLIKVQSSFDQIRQCFKYKSWKIDKFDYNYF